MIEKARRAAAFLSWYNQTSLSEVRFALTYMFGLDFFSFHYLDVFVFLFLFSTKKGGGGVKMQIFISLFSFSDILCIFT